MTENNELEDILEENDKLRSDLGDARVRLMNLLGNANQITDGDIGVEIEKLQDAIEIWVNNIQQDIRNEGRDFKSLFDLELSRLDLTDDSASRSQHSPLPRIFNCGEATNRLDLEWMKWASKLSTCIYFVLSRHIWNYLEDNIFNDIYPVGVSGSSAQIFNEILSVMRNTGNDGGRCIHLIETIAADRDQDRILLAHKWRSDTINSLTKTPYFVKQKQTDEIRLLEGLIRSLGIWIDREILRRHDRTLHDNVIRRAIDLHERITCSTEEYLPLPPNISQGMKDKSILSTANLKDITRWRPFYGDVDGVFQCLYPGICRRGMPDQGHVVAAPPVILVYDYETSKTIPAATSKSQPQSRRNSEVYGRESLQTPPSTVITTKRASTLPNSKDLPTTNRQDVRGILGGLFGNPRRGSRDDRSSSSVEDHLQPRTTTWPSFRTKPPESSRSGKAGKQHKSASRSRQYSRATPPLLGKLTSASEEQRRPRANELRITCS